MTITSHTIRIIDARQSRQPSWWKGLLMILVAPGVLMWPGTIMGSAAMQWAGFILLLIFILMFVARFLDDFVTPDEARKLIDKIENKTDPG